MIFKGVGGFYYVNCEGTLYECRGRGIFKNQGITPMVGDRVSISVVDEQGKQGVVERILPRRSEFVRPAVANIDQMVIVFSAAAPEPKPLMIDKLILLAEASEVSVVLCFNKSDLDTGDGLERLRSIYTSLGYPVVITCAHSGEGISDLLRHLKDRISVFSGPSGVGKSSLLNALQSRYTVEVGAVSERIQRGRHTTRHSELFQLQESGIVVDTPGFAALSTAHIEPERVRDGFIEFQTYQSACRFDNCSHVNEPGCAVKAAVASGAIFEERYASYGHIYAEAVEKRRRKKW